MIDIKFINKYNLLHRNNNKPSWFDSNGDINYNLNGVLHRIDGPAVIYGNVRESYYINGKWYNKEDYYEKLKELNNNH